MKKIPVDSLTKIYNFIRSNGISAVLYLIAYITLTNKNYILGAIIFIIAFLWPPLKSQISNLLYDINNENNNGIKGILFHIFSRKYENFRLNFSDDFKRDYYKFLLRKYKFYKGPKSRKDAFPVDLNKVFVPLSFSPNSREKISTNILPNYKKKEILDDNETRNSFDIWQVISNTSNIRQVAILGFPGSGKTTLLHHLTVIYASNSHRSKNSKSPKFIPVLLKLRSKAISELIISYPETSLENIIQEDLIHQNLYPEPDLRRNSISSWFEIRMKNGDCLIMLDGLDEVANDSDRHKIFNWVDRQMRRYPYCFFIITSRPKGYWDNINNESPIEMIKTNLEIQPFNNQQVKRFIHNWYLYSESDQINGDISGTKKKNIKEKAENLIDYIFNDEVLKEMAVNPLMLNMIAITHRSEGILPHNKIRLYKEICEIFLKRRQSSQVIENIDDQLKLLQIIALGLMQGKTSNGKSTKFTLNEGAFLIEKQLEYWGKSDIDSHSFIRELSITEIIIESEIGVFEFAHKSLQEYLAAMEISDKNIDILTYNLDDPWWEETIRFYALKDSNKIVERALKQSTVRSLAIAYDIAQQPKSKLDKRLKEKLESKLEDGLVSNDDKQFKLSASVMLLRRLSSFKRINRDLYIDNSYITNIEYKLFLETQEPYDSNSSEKFIFNKEEIKSPLRNISHENINIFCKWLNENYLYSNEIESNFLYRNLSKAEVKKYSDNSFNKSSIYLAKEYIKEPLFQNKYRIAAHEDTDKCRAIGILRGRYIYSENFIGKGKLILSDQTEVDAVLLKSVLKTATKLDLSKEQYWVVYPRTRGKNPRLHVQIKGVKMPKYKNEKKSKYFPKKANSIKPKFDFFSIFGEVIYLSSNNDYVMVKIIINSKNRSNKSQFFKLRLEGRLPVNARGLFWEFEAKREKDKLVIVKLSQP